MKLHYMIISILIVSLIAIGAMDYVSDLGDNYGTTADLTRINRTITGLNETRQSAMDLGEEITSFKLSLNPIDLLSLPYKMIQVAWSSGKTMFNAWGTVGDIIVDTGAGIDEVTGSNLSQEVIKTIIAIIVIILVAIVVYGFFKWRFSD